jgi:hypothetical protein
MTEKEIGKENKEFDSTGVDFINHLNDEIYGFPMKKLICSAGSGTIIAL